jgi:hypothetical protein
MVAMPSFEQALDARFLISTRLDKPYGCSWQYRTPTEINANGVIWSTAVGSSWDKPVILARFAKCRFPT